MLDRPADDLAGSRNAIMLADSAARLVDLRCGTRWLRGRMENTGARLGRRFVEETTGTHAIATTFEARQPDRDEVLRRRQRVGHWPDVRPVALLTPA